MAEAWMVRNLERQKLLEELMSEVYRYDDKNQRDRVCNASMQLVDVIIKFLYSVKSALADNNTWRGETEAHKLFENSFLPKIVSFARSELELYFLLAELSKKILNSALTPIRSALMHIEIIDPQLIFHAPSAMSPMKLPKKL